MIAQTRTAILEGFPEIQILEMKKDSLKREIDIATAYRDKLQKEYDFERFGTKTDGTSGITGLGINALKKEQQLDAAQQELDLLKARQQMKIDYHESEINDLLELNQLKFEKRAPQIESFAGLAAGLDALHVLTMESDAIKWANVFILLLFIAIETAPIFVKVISFRGPYDDMIDLKEENVRVYTKEQSRKLNVKIERNIQSLESEFSI